MPCPGYTDVVTAIYQAALRPELWAGVLELVADYLEVDSGMVLHLCASRNGNFIVHRRLREDLNELFLQQHTANAYGFAFARAPIGKALVTAALIDKEVLHRSAFYADILAPQGIVEIIAARHSDLSREGAGGILFNVSKPRADNVERAATRLDDLISHLFRAIDLTLLTSRLNASQLQVDRLLASIGNAIVLLDGDGSILGMTAAAETLLGERDGLVIIKRGQLTLGAQSRQHSAALASSIKQALAVARGEPQNLAGILQIKRPSGRSALLVQVTPLPAPALAPWSAIDGSARVMVQIVDPQASIHAQAERLRVLVGLTPAETRVAALLGSGLGLTETATALGVSLNTVKTHARQVFAKAGVRSSAALARLVASIPVGPTPISKSS
ncbi:helix-turn-helix transcriptional regulator [Bradyrhizobium sp. ARR65]|uniref:helix-turn-helix transcriptional regulator n=1 Tax=Bradyrhizobium sp. ARR65 TaxID=1040989 RepID=UPI0005597DF8|nr:helix-turn-helix transcriptional regulator [Bradyrhizobium sp. ARR65]